MNLKGLIQELSARGLPAHESERILESSARWILGERLNRSEVYSLDVEDSLLERMKLLAFEMAERRTSGEPLQYILGEQQFLDHFYSVAPGVLIPRPETEGLVRLIQNDLSACPPKVGIEIGVGSGVISVELLSQFPELEMWSTDQSDEAIRLTRTNAGVILGPENSERLTLLKSDALQVFEPVIESDFRGGADLIVSNPPYLSESDEIAEDVALHEPREALFGPQSDPEYFYRRIAEQGRELLRPGAPIYLEIPHTRGALILELFHNHGYTGKLYPDLTGRDRILVARER